LDILGGLQVQIDSFWYNMLLSVAGLQWSLQRGFIMMGYTVELINQWLVNEAFAPLIQQTNSSLSTAVSLVFVIALLILGLTYLLEVFIRLDVVNFRSAAMWYVAGLLFFSLGPSLYQGMNDFRSTVAQAFYVSTLSGLQGNINSTFDSLNQVQTTDLGIAPLCDYLGVYLPGATGASGIDGLDVALLNVCKNRSTILCRIPLVMTNNRLRAMVKRSRIMSMRVAQCIGLIGSKVVHPNNLLMSCAIFALMRVSLVIYTMTPIPSCH